MSSELIARINALAKKKKTTGLTEEEQAEQTRLRRVYLEGIKAQLKDTLERIELVDAAEPPGEAGGAAENASRPLN